MTAGIFRPIAATPPGLLPLRLAFRELRGGLRGFYVFIACIALGVMAIAGVGSFSRSLTDGLAREGSVILGGDAVFSLIQREARADERAFLRKPRPRIRRRHHARHGTHAGRTHDTGRDQSGGRRLSALRHGSARSGHSACPRDCKRATAFSALPPIRRCWRGSISRSATASRSAPPRSRSPRH